MKHFTLLFAVHISHLYPKAQLKTISNVVIVRVNVNKAATSHHQLSCKSFVDHVTL